MKYSTLAIIAIVALVAVSTFNFGVQTKGQATGELSSSISASDVRSPTTGCEKCNKALYHENQELKEQVASLQAQLAACQSMECEPEENSFDISAPRVIDVPGSYRVINDFTVPQGGIGIDILVPGVTIDMQEYTISGGEIGIRGGNLVIIDGNRDVPLENRGGVADTTGSGIVLGNDVTIENLYVRGTGSNPNDGSASIIIGDNAAVKFNIIEDFYHQAINFGSNSEVENNYVQIDSSKMKLLGIVIHTTGSGSNLEENYVISPTFGGSENFYGARLDGANNRAVFNEFIYSSYGLGFSGGNDIGSVAKTYETVRQDGGSWNLDKPAGVPVEVRPQTIGVREAWELPLSQETYTVDSQTTITQPGLYVLTQDVTVPVGQIGIDIQSPGVTINLQDHRITGGLTGIRGVDNVHVFGDQTNNINQRAQILDTTGTAIELGNYGYVENIHIAGSGSSSSDGSAAILTGDNADIFSNSITDYHYDGIRFGEQGFLQFNYIEMDLSRAGSSRAAIYSNGVFSDVDRNYIFEPTGTSTSNQYAIYLNNNNQFSSNDVEGNEIVFSAGLRCSQGDYCKTVYNTYANVPESTIEWNYHRVPGTTAEDRPNRVGLRNVWELPAE